MSDIAERRRKFLEEHPLEEVKPAQDIITLGNWRLTTSLFGAVYLDWHGKTFRRSQMLVVYSDGKVGWDWPEVATPRDRERIERAARTLVRRYNENRTGEKS